MKRIHFVALSLLITQILFSSTSSGNKVPVKKYDNSEVFWVLRATIVSYTDVRPILYDDCHGILFLLTAGKKLNCAHTNNYNSNDKALKEKARSEINWFMKGKWKPDHYTTGSCVTVRDFRDYLIVNCLKH